MIESRSRAKEGVREGIYEPRKWRVELEFIA